jgi:hypothetical protein
MQTIDQPQAKTQIDSLQIGSQDFKDKFVPSDALFRKKRSLQPIHLGMGAITQKFHCDFHQASSMPPSLHSSQSCANGWEAWHLHSFQKASCLRRKYSVSGIFSHKLIAYCPDASISSKMGLT